MSRLRKPVKDLYCDFVGSEPTNYDFGEGYAERWELVYPEGWDFNSDERSEDEISPMMNYYYPIKLDRVNSSEEGAHILDKFGGNICLVYFTESEDYAMALTGGGMDLSWDICEGYMLLGYLPPIHFCDLPNFAGMKLTAKNKWILNGCLRSCQVSMYQAKNLTRDLKALKKKMKGVK